MDTILNRRLGRDSAYEDLKAYHRKARISGITCFIIGSAATYVVLKLPKTSTIPSKYIPLACLGFGACIGYAKSIMVLQEYNNLQQKSEESKYEDNHDTSIVNSTKNGPSVTHSKYGDEGFYLDEKKS